MDEWKILSQKRLDVLETFFEVCARLIKQDKLDELACALKPFSEDVSSREMTTW